MQTTHTPADFLAFTAEQVDGLTTNAKKAIQRGLVQAPNDVCTWAQANLEHWISLARDKMHKNITINNAQQAACDIVKYLCKYYQLPKPSK